MGSGAALLVIRLRPDRSFSHRTSDRKFPLVCGARFRKTKKKEHYYEVMHKALARNSPM